MATEEPSKVSKVSKMSSDETEVSAIVCGSHHLLFFFSKKEISPFPLFAYFLSSQEIALLILTSFFSQQDATEAIVADASDIAEAVTVGKGKKGKKHEEVVEGEEVGEAGESKPEKEKKEKSHAAAMIIGDSESMPEQIAREDDTR